MRVFLATLGCRANQYDTECVRAMLLAGGCEVTKSVSEADAAIFNSCAVTSEAEADLRQRVRRAARTNPRLQTVVMGCAASLDRGAIRGLPTVKHVIAGADLDQVAAALDLPPSVSTTRARSQMGTRALLRIQDGCDEHCTFCATTIARGRNRSRPQSDLLKEALELAENHAEIVITGVHIGSYGRDSGSSLGQLMAALVVHASQARFRLTSIEATELDGQLRELLTDGGCLAPHLHAPLQSGSDRVLRRMGRHWYTARSYAAAVERIVAHAGPFGLGADVITGFPGETEADHAATRSLIHSLPFTYLHVFQYSERPGTPASRLDDQVARETAGRRSAELRQDAGRLSAAYMRRRCGQPADVIVIGSPSPNPAAGRPREALTEDFLTVEPADSCQPRGTRFRARLECNGATLLAHALP
ncbi:MAG: MiaB/RimO family radical SAM methylthiotransferase [Gemmatimonadaceae bacterium]